MYVSELIKLKFYLKKKRFEELWAYNYVKMTDKDKI